MPATSVRPKRKTIGLISDTHGLVRPEALKALVGVDLVIHAGDIGSFGVIRALRSIATVIAVRGNVDQGPWAESLPETKKVQAGRTSIFIVHDVKQIKVSPLLEGIHVVVSGHSHRPSIVERNGVLFINPGSAGPRRFKFPIAVGILHVNGCMTKGEIVELYT